METERAYCQVELNSNNWTNLFLPQDLVSGHLEQCSYMIKNPNGLL